MARRSSFDKGWPVEWAPASGSHPLFYLLDLGCACACGWPGLLNTAVRSSLVATLWVAASSNLFAQDKNSAPAGMGLQSVYTINIALCGHTTLLNLIAFLDFPRYHTHGDIYIYVYIYIQNT